ncbi:MAG TPA: DMT family transporter [Geminicoccaceae bacterium]
MATRPSGGRAADTALAATEGAASRARLRTLKGIFLMLASTFMFAAMHATIRTVSAELHPFEIAFFRNLFGFLIVVPWLIRYGIGPLRTSRPGLHLLRGAFNIVAMLSFFTALTIAPLAEVTALNFTAPIFATLLAIPIFKETVRLRRWTAIVLGFAGVLIILRPGFAGAGTGQLLALLAAVTWGCALLVIKRLGQSDSSITIIAWMAMMMIPASFVPALFVWQTPSLGALGWLVLIGLLGNMGQLAMTEAIRQADASVVMPIDFFKLIWVALLGYLLFAEVPGIFTWIGGAIIFTSTAYIAYREQQVTRARR